MEQGNCLDSTRMSAVQEVETRTDGEPALDAAIVNLLQDQSAIAIPPDPILAAIAETQRLMHARHVANDLPQPPGSIAVLPEQNAATDAFFAHVNNVLLKTVPTSAVGCAALARYACEFLANEGFPLDENLNNDQHVRVLNLIARSPLGRPAGSASPPLADTLATEATELASAILDYFGEKEIDPVLDADIALRERAWRISILSGVQGSHPDHELAEIGEQWLTLVSDAEAALTRLYDAEEACVAPETPRELRVYGYDIANGFPRPPQRSDGYAPYGLDQVEELRATPRMAVYVGGKPEGERLEGGGYRRIDPHGQKRAEAIIAAWDIWKAEKDRRELALDIPALQIAAAEACQARDDAALRARSIKAQTIAGLRVKAEVAAALIPWRDRDAEAARLEADEETGILYTLVTDTLAVLGGTGVRRVVAR